MFRGKDSSGRRFSPLLLFAPPILVVFALVAARAIFGDRLLGLDSVKWANGVPYSTRSLAAAEKVSPALKAALAEKGLEFGSPVFVRIFKAEGVLEVWVLDEKAGTYALFRTYAMRNFSGALGPKQKEGDRQAPEGFYYVTSDRMNPLSRFHLSFNIGYPNEYDRAHGSNGSAIMVHGGWSSIGCFAMGNDAIEEIYTLAGAALANGQPFFRVHVFPFRMTDAEMAARKEPRWEAFWTNLKTGYDFFENKKVPPDAHVVNGAYAFEQAR